MTHKCLPLLPDSSQHDSVFQSVVDRKSVELTQSVWGMTDGSLARAFTGGFEKLAASVNRMVMTSGGVLKLGGFELQCCPPLQIHVSCDVFRFKRCFFSHAVALMLLRTQFDHASGVVWNPRVFLTFHLPSASRRLCRPGLFSMCMGVDLLRNLGDFLFSKLYTVYIYMRVFSSRLLSDTCQQQKSRILPLDVVPRLWWHSRYVLFGL